MRFPMMQLSSEGALHGFYGFRNGNGEYAGVSIVEFGAPALIAIFKRWQALRHT